MAQKMRANTHSFAAAFIVSQINKNLSLAEYSRDSHKFFITNLRIVDRDKDKEDTNQNEEIVLYDSYVLILERRENDLPISDVGSFQAVPQGWEEVEGQESLLSDGSVFCVRKGAKDSDGKYLHTVQVYDESQEQKIEETTQPSLTDKSQLLQNYLKIELGKDKKYLNFTKISQIDAAHLRFKPEVTSLFERTKKQLDIPNLAILCFPEGVRIFKKQTGFKFFTFILTTDSAQRYYCNSIIFTERMNEEQQQILQKNFGIQNQKGIFSQKVFTIISEYSCTDQTNKCLEHLYRVYLSKPYDFFQQKINNLPNTFLIDLQTNKSSFQIQNFGICFKINSSYPQTSTQAIYGVFKFLQVENIVTVVQNLLLERKVFFISDCENMVGMAIEAFLSFIYPMNWIHGIINPLSSSMIQYSEAPMTITFGLSNDLATKIKPNVDGLFVYLDKNKVVLQNNSVIKMVPSLRKHLIQRISEFDVYDKIDVRDYLLNPENLSLFKTQKIEDPHFDAYKIRNIFFELTVFMLRYYKNYFLAKCRKNSSCLTESGERGIKKYYDLNGILQVYKKDPFMTCFLQTSLFSVMIQKKIQQPQNKWMKTLDKAIKKIASFKKHYIQQQSDNNCSDGNEFSHDQEQQMQDFAPRGCPSFVFPLRWAEDHKFQSPSPKKSVSLQDKTNNKQIAVSPSKCVPRMSLPNQFQNKNMISSSPQIKLSINSNESAQKTQKQTDKGSDTCGKSQTSIPQLQQQNQIVMVYDYNENQTVVKSDNAICEILSYPYRGVSNSVVSRWIKKKIQRIKAWKNQKVKKQLNQQNPCIEMPASVCRPSPKKQ